MFSKKSLLLSFFAYSIQASATTYSCQEFRENGMSFAYRTGVRPVLSVADASAPRRHCAGIRPKFVPGGLCALLKNV